MVSVNRSQRHILSSAIAVPKLGWLSELWTWHAASAAGIVAVFIGLAIDAWKHSSPSAGEESLLSLSNPGHAIAGSGVVVATLGILLSLSVLGVKSAQSVGSARRALALVTAVWVLIVSSGVGSLTYIATTGATVGHQHGASAESTGAHEVGAAHVHTAGTHDHGPHATFAQIMALPAADVASLFPMGTMSEADIPRLRTQLQVASAAGSRLNTTELAEAAGYRLITTDVDYMGLHYLNIEHVTDGVFDPSRPEGLLFSRTSGPAPELVGLWFLQLPGVGDVVWDTAPDGFAGTADYWHGHQNVCLPFEEEGVTEASCTARGGRFVLDSRWMMHAWVVSGSGENPDGVFSYLNRSLYVHQVAYSRGDPDSDGDGLSDQSELRFGYEPIQVDSDSNGVADGREFGWLARSIRDLPDRAFESADGIDRNDLLSALDRASRAVQGGDVAAAVVELRTARQYVDQCAVDSQAANWMELCSRQAETRDLLDLLIANIAR